MMMADRLQVVPNSPLAPPYPADTAARGFTFSLNPRRIKASDTWALAAVELRPWLLMLWFESWEQIPCGSFPDDDELIAARIGMPLVMFQTHCKVLMRGWRRHSDGRLYHPVVTELVLARIEWREAEKKRKTEYREKQALTKVSHGTDKKSHVVDDTGAGAGAGAGAKSNTKPKTIVATALPTIPDWIPADPWAEFVRMRRSIRKPLSPYATRLAFGKLEAMRTEGHNLQAVLEQSTFNCWQGLFPPKDVASAGATGWWTSESATLAKQAELGLSSRSNESWTQLRARIANAIKGKT